MTPITDILPPELILNVLIFCDATTLARVSRSNRIFYFLTCRDAFGDEILWRCLFLYELKQLQALKDGGFNNTIKKFLHKGKFPKLKSPIQFTDEDDKVISLANIYAESVDLSHIEVMGPGENRKNLLQWKSAYVAHFRAKTLVQVRTELKKYPLLDILTSELFWNRYEQFPDIICEIVRKDSMLQRVVQEVDTRSVDTQWLKGLFQIFGVPDDILHFIRGSAFFYLYFKMVFPDQFVKLLLYKHEGALLLCKSCSFRFDLFEEVVTDYLLVFEQQILEKEPNLDKEEALNRAKDMLLDGYLWSSNCHYKSSAITCLMNSYRYINKFDKEKTNELIRKLNFLYDLGDDPTKPAEIDINTTTFPIALASGMMGTVVAWFLDRGASPKFGNRNVLQEAIVADAPMSYVRQIYMNYPICRELVNCHHPSVHLGQNILHIIAQRYQTYYFEEWRFILGDMSPDLCWLTSTRGKTPVTLIIDHLPNVQALPSLAVEFLQELVDMFKRKSQYLFLKSDIDILRQYENAPQLAHLSPFVQQLIALLEPYEIPIDTP